MPLVTLVGSPMELSVLTLRPFMALVAFTLLKASEFCDERQDK